MMTTISSVSALTFFQHLQDITEKLDGIKYCETQMKTAEPWEVKEYQGVIDAHQLHIQSLRNALLEGWTPSERGFLLGQWAFKTGLKRVPHHDPILRLVNSHLTEVGSTIEITGAWLKGWDSGNFTKPIK